MRYYVIGTDSFGNLYADKFYGPKSKLRNEFEGVFNTRQLAIERIEYLTNEKVKRLKENLAWIQEHLK